MFTRVVPLVGRLPLLSLGASRPPTSLRSEIRRETPTVLRHFPPYPLITRSSVSLLSTSSSRRRQEPPRGATRSLPLISFLFHSPDRVARFALLSPTGNESWKRGLHGCARLSPSNLGLESTVITMSASVPVTIPSHTSRYEREPRGDRREPRVVTGSNGEVGR